MEESVLRVRTQPRLRDMKPAEAPDHPPSLAVGAILGDSDFDSMEWSRAIGALSMEVAGQQEGVRSAVRLNVVFHVDGRLVPNEFVGIRTGRFNRGTNILVIQAAVSKVPVDDRRSLLLSLLEDAVAVAESHLRTKGHADGLPQIRRAVQTLPRSVSE
jgi:hypothetical protein